MNSKEYDNLQPIDLRDLMGRLWKAFRKLWILAVLLAVGSAAFSLNRAYRSFTPMYECSARFAVNAGYDTEDLYMSSYYNNAAASQLAQDFPYILQTELMQNLMRQELDKGYVNGSVTASCVADTNIFILTVRSSNPQDAYDVLWAVIDCYPQVAVYIAEDPYTVILEEPIVPQTPYNSFSWQSSVKRGASRGLMLGLALVVVLALLSKTVTSVDQLRSIANLPVLAVFPHVEVKKRRKGRQQFASAESNQELVEPLVGLTMKLRKNADGKHRKVILITSTLAGEGKTTVAVNLAQELAREGKRVALVDGDLRKQSVAARFGKAPGENGLMQCLKDREVSVMESLIPSGKENLSFLSGKSAANLRYKIDSTEMERVLKELTDNFDFVVIDSAPCAQVADTTLMCRHADCVLYVVKPDYARKLHIFDTINELDSRDIPVAGFVFNGVPKKHSDYGYGYKYGYGYGYGSKYGYSGKRSARN